MQVEGKLSFNTLQMIIGDLECLNLPLTVSFWWFYEWSAFLETGTGRADHQDNPLPPFGSGWCHISELRCRPGTERARGSERWIFLWWASEEDKGERGKWSPDHRKEDDRACSGRGSHKVSTQGHQFVYRGKWYTIQLNIYWLVTRATCI